MTETTVYYLEMNDPVQHQKKAVVNDFVITEALVKQAKVNRFLYDLVGEDWLWFDRLQWSGEKWTEYAEADQLRTWIAYSSGSIAGYFELKKIKNEVTEIAYFGLAPKFVGRGYGGYFLSRAIAEAWAWFGTERVIVNTCTQDHPGALANYKARGFKVYKVEQIGG